MKLLMGVLISSHILACVFFAVARSQTGPNVGGERSQWNSLDTTPLDYQYFTSLHWAFSSLILESTDLSPTTTTERAFNVCALLIGLIIFSSVVSRLTTAIMHLQDMAQDRSKQ